jgi:acyl transferase domain-containing protein/NAD(P)H-dependent flavin oxidoreductase YrpB (nitropropane dioxygenase family)
MSLQRPEILALAAVEAGGVGVVAAAGRAGALGVLDLEGLSSGEAVAAIREAARFASRGFGVRATAGALAVGRLDGAPGGLDAVIAAGGPATDWAGALGAIRGSGAGRRALAEVTDRESAVAARRAGFDGVVVAGLEAGGRCGEESSFVLLQAALADGAGPAWVRGGIGPNAAAGCAAAGAAGVVLDGALLLARESTLDDRTREAIGRLDGGETSAVGPAGGPLVRVLATPGAPGLARLEAAAAEGGDAWAGAVAREVGWGPGRLRPVGQDAALAAELARRFGTVGGIVRAVSEAIARNRAAAAEHRPLAPGSPLARSHGTTYPIVQGPMTRVSDGAAFADAVAKGGGLPFLALAMLRGPAVAALLADASRTLGRRPWGVGVLGFVPPELRAEQVEAIRRARPPFALIAGGRPDQAAELEHAGIATYLHVPSPGLLNQYLKDGARRFVLEGRECGGHVGPRSSLVLWEQAVGALAEAIDRGRVAEPGGLHVLFAGGVHDATSAAAVSAIAAPLAERGAKVGALVGTAYLFTREAVQTGAIVPAFQAEAIACRRTVLLRTGPGHEVRVAPSPFVERFEAERRRLAAEGAGADAAREALEALNAGRLRVAAKGLERDGDRLVPLDEPAQRERGLYMLGQVAALRDRATTVEALHAEIGEGSAALLAAGAAATVEPAEPASRPSDVAIVGMSAIFPGAPDVRAFWRNTLDGVDAITEVPPDRWDWRAYYDPDPKAPDKVVSKWGGFVPDVPFDPLRYGMPPSSLPSIEPAQLLVLEAVRAALDDAGYAERAFPRERTAVVLGMGGGAAQLAMGYAVRSYLPMLEAVAPGVGEAARDGALPFLPEWTEDSFPGFLLNVTAGRVANRFDLGGANYTVDAACGSSLAAAALAVRELETGAADMVVLGGADTVQNPFTYLAFSKTHAFSPRGRCRPFDASADGIVISEGVGVVILKRLADAERDGDRIYAVIKGIGCSSDGRDRGLTAPNGEGQGRALRRAYAKAGIDPATVGYVEAHGTGTAVGDVVEVNALAGFLRESGAAPGSCVVGSVKSMIGHTKCAAGLAGLINATLALHHRVVPPTIGVEAVNPAADLHDGPLRVGRSAQPWLHAAGTPRRAGVSAFGFGGTNFHAVLEAYEADPTPRRATRDEWPAELLVWRAESAGRLGSDLGRLSAQLDAGASPRLRDLAHTLALRFDADRPGPTLAIVADSLDDLKAKLATARAAVDAGKALRDPRGVYYADAPAFAGERPAFLFPGQGSQAVGMLGDLALAFDEVRGGFEAIDAALAAAGRPPVGPKVFPPAALDDAARERARLDLTATEHAQPAVGAASLGMLRLLRALGLEPAAAAGHSFGELVALHAAGSLDEAALAALADARGRLMRDAAGPEPGAMAALAAGPDRARDLIEGLPGVVIANQNGPRQTVIAGPRDALAAAVERARGSGVRAFELPVACAFHSPRVAAAAEPLAALAGARIAAAPAIPVYSNLDAEPHPADPSAIAGRLGAHLASPVRFAAMVERMYEAGARVFVECGPGATLTGLVGSILADRPHLAVSCDAPGRPGIPTLLHALAQFAVAGMPWRPGRLASGRGARRLDLDRLADAEPGPPASTWLVNGSRARPIGGPEPKRLGQAPELLGVEPRAPRAAERNGRPHVHETNGHAMPHDANGRASKAGLASRNGTNGHLRNGHAPEPPRVPEPRPRGGSDRVMEAFQETMRAFLGVQEATMLAYLSGRSPAPAARPRVPELEAVPEPSPPPTRIETPPTRVEPAPAKAEPMPPEPAPRAAGSVEARLVEIVRDRTGYPAEMLGLGLDLEADLGIDSIKRVEILGTLRESVAGLSGSSQPGLMDSLARAKTLGEIVAKVEAALGASEAGATEGPAPRAPEAPKAADPVPPAPADAAPRRLMLEPVAAPLPPERPGLPPGGVVIVTDDGRGVGEALARSLREDGLVAERVGPGRVDLASEAAVETLVGAIRADRPIAGIVHALPLRAAGPSGLDPEAWRARIEPELTGFFQLARAAADDLERSARRGGAALIAATALGGAFGSAGALAESAFPGDGGLAGLVKTLAREWPSVRARVVDLDPREPAEDLAAFLADELRADDGWAEVGYVDGRRVRLRASARPLAGAGATLELPAGAPVVVTGGARGITASVAEALARAWRPTLLLVGSGPPPEAERPETAGIPEGPDLKAALLRRLRRGGSNPSPGDLERAHRALVSNRCKRETLSRLKRLGCPVEYARADVRDASALARALDDWRRRHGAPAGLIHGAGVIHDKLLRDKTPASFRRVLGTKLDGALNLARLLDGEALRFSAFFSSIAGRFGNEGQSDYAAANEALNKLALWLDRRWPGRVVSVTWGPWSGVGMVSELEAHLGRRGLGMIDPARGSAALIDEIRHGRKGEVEVILAGALGALEAPLRSGLREPAGVSR